MKTMRQARTDCSQQGVDVIDGLLEPFHAADGSAWKGRGIQKGRLSKREKQESGGRMF